MTALMHAGYAQSMSGVVGPVSPASAGNSSSGGGASWKRQIIGQIHQRNQKEVTAYADVFGACQSWGQCGHTDTARTHAVAP